MGGGNRAQGALGIKQEPSYCTGYHAHLVVAVGHKPWGSQSPTLLALPVGTLHSSANHFAEVNNPIPLKHAGAPFPVTVAVNPPALAKGATTRFVHRFEKMIPCFLEFLAPFVYAHGIPPWWSLRLWKK